MSWNKGYTKYTHPGVKKISQTMKLRSLDNFKIWRDKMKSLGKIKSVYPELKKDGDLAELIGVILGDGNIYKFPRTEGLRIACNSNNKGFVRRYSNLIKKIFNKKPQNFKVKKVNCITITIYEKFISKRLGIRAGSRKNIKISIPRWIFKNKEYTIRYLRGLYEAEGSFCIHKPTSTYKLLFSNRNDYLLDIVYKRMNWLGFKVNKSGYKVQISRKDDVLRAIDLIRFRKYN